MARTRRKKKHTQDLSQNSGVSQNDKVPKNFVIARGKLPIFLRNLQHDIRKLMSPHTALHLKETEKNTLKDFLHVAGPLGVTHLLIMSNTKMAPYLRIARLPHGPTLTFKVHAYSLAADIARAQAHPRAPVSIFQSPPLVVLNGFGGVEEHLRLITIMFQNIFPIIDVNSVKLATCQRVLLLNYNKDTKLIDLRHYSISAQPTGVSRGIRKLVQRNKLPDLGALSDVSEFISKTGYGSESEVENETSKVHLPDKYGRGNHPSQQSAVKLHEVGPRMTLQLVKVEEGLCSGAIMFHEYVKKTPEQIRALKEKIERKEALRRQRKAEQEANVERKLLLKKRQHAKGLNENVDLDGKNQDHDQPQADEMDDADWYRQEVGEEPDEGFFSKPSSRKVNPRDKSTRRAKQYDVPLQVGLSQNRFASSKHDSSMSNHEGGKRRTIKHMRAGHGDKESSKRRVSFKDSEGKVWKKKKMVR